MSDKLNTGESVKVLGFVIALVVGIIAFVWIVYAQIIQPAIADFNSHIENHTSVTQGP